MTGETISEIVGRVESLHLHSSTGRQEMLTVDRVELVESKGILGESRYFGRVSADGQPNKRQLSIIEREQIAGHATQCGLPGIPPGVVRSNIETSGIELGRYMDRDVQIGEAVVHFHSPRTPCEQMNAICQGLKEMMENGKQGVMATIVRSGAVKVGDPVRVLPAGKLG